MELKIPGVGEPETAATHPGAEKGDAGTANLPAPGTESTSAPNPTARFLALAAACIGVAAAAWAFVLQKDMANLHRQLVSAQNTAEDALRIAKTLPPPKDFTPDIARLEATMAARLKVAEDLKRIPALEARLGLDLKAITNTVAGMAATTQSVRDALREDETKIADIVAVLKNQDKVLRRLAANPIPARQ